MSRTTAEFLTQLKKADKGDKWLAERKVADTVKRGEEDNWDEARMLFAGYTKQTLAKKAKAGIKRIEEAYNSPEVQKHLKTMHKDSDFYTNKAVA